MEEIFGLVIPRRSGPIGSSSFTQIDGSHWVLDTNPLVGKAYDEVNALCIFLPYPGILPSDKALAVYIQSPGSPFLFCGAVTSSCPSAILRLPWPEPGIGGEMGLTASGNAPLSAKIGISVEDLAALPSLAVATEKRIEQLEIKIGENCRINFTIAME